MQKIIDAVDKYSRLILDAERYIWKNPETGFKEYKTSAYMEKVFNDLGYDVIKAGNIPGFYTTLDTGKEGPTVLVLGELDSIICPEHPESDPDTGAVHACGHNAQCAALIGVAAALKELDVKGELCGKIKLCAVPAEELLEIEYRKSLKEQGVIKYFGGKVEFLYRGFFDDVDLSFMVHASTRFGARAGMIGCVAKNITYKGVAAHAGGAPWNGKNALYAATCGINAINALRETFAESDIVRVHPIITKGGSMVNAIPETVTLESYVRGKTFDAIKKSNQKVNRAICGAALSLGNNVEIIDSPGYAPLNNDKNLLEIAAQALKKVAPQHEFKGETSFSSGCTDMGDLSCVMPAVHPYCGGATGLSHGSDYQISDPVAACVDSAKMQVAMLYILLSNGGEMAKKVIAESVVPFKTKKEFFDYIDAFNCAGNRIEYFDDGTAKINMN